MAVKGTLSKDTLLSYEISTYLRAAALSESRVGRIIAADGECSVIWSPEYGANDFGILVDSEYPEGLQADGIGKFAQLIDTSEGLKPIVPLDVKNMMPRSIYGAIAWSVKLTEQQRRTCQAIIILSPREPNFCVFLPVRYLRQRKFAADFRLRGFQPLWTLHPLPAFPPDLTPFVTPLSKLKQTVTDMRNFATGTATQWINGHTGVTLVDVPRPDSFDLSVLQPDSTLFQRALDEIIALFRAFDKYSSMFTVRFFDIRPILGDFKVAHLGTGIESFVEAKTRHCRIREIGETGKFMLQHSQTALPSPTRAVFTWRAQWDFLYSHVISESDREQALFVPRDKIPKNWWNVPLSDEVVWLDWPADHPESFHRYLVDRTADDDLVRDIERVLGVNSAKAQEPIPLASITPTSITETDTPPEITASFFREEYWNSSTYQRGYGSAAHTELKGDTYHVWASEVLLEMCRARGRGTVLDLGIEHTLSRYWLADYMWSEDDISRYDQDKDPPCLVWQLGPLTPIIPISFMRLRWYHGLEPWCVRSSEYSFMGIARRPPSLVICDVFPYTCTRLPHGRFLLPSNSLPEEVSYGKDLVFKEGALDQYSVDHDEVVDSILYMLDGTSQATLGLCSRPIQTSEYISYLRDVLQEAAAGYAERSKGEDDREDDMEDAKEDDRGDDMGVDDRETLPTRRL